jgi:hypothetical protein
MDNMQEHEKEDLDKCEEIKSELEDLLESEKSEGEVGDKKDIALIEKMLSILKEITANEAKEAGMSEFVKKPLDKMEEELKNSKEE